MSDTDPMTPRPVRGTRYRARAGVTPDPDASARYLTDALAIPRGTIGWAAAIYATRLREHPAPDDPQAAPTDDTPAT